MEEVKVLDHGYVRLIDSMGNDLSIVRNARVSHDAAWRAGENEGSDARLIRYLWRNKHSTPFEAVTFTFEIKAPIFVLRQWHRHRTWTYNELSARYRELPEEFYVPEWNRMQRQGQTNKQSSDEETLSEDLCAAAHQYMTDSNTTAFIEYKNLLTMGLSRELARTVLPLATYSHMFATVNLLNLFKFITLRNDTHAQYEIQVYARAMRELISPIIPVALSAFDKENTNA